MRAVVQRVSRAGVTVEGRVTGRVDRGLVVLLGVEQGDTRDDAAYICQKVAGLRIFTDAQDKMNLSVTDVGGAVLLISQFTLLGDARKGRRPSFSSAAAPETADALYRHCAALLTAAGITVQTGVFGASMAVELINEGPVTILLDSRRAF